MLGVLIAVPLTLVFCYYYFKYKLAKFGLIVPYVANENGLGVKLTCQIIGDRNTPVKVIREIDKAQSLMRRFGGYVEDLDE